MIQRIVLVKLKAEYDNPAARTEIMDKSRAVLVRCHGVKHVDIGAPADERSAKDWDLCLMVRFEQIEDVPVYVDDPVHREYVDTFLSPRTEIKKAWNFEV
ncbi:hypothetical protein ABI59_08665 [Acidobacteria bacterium Mor1]|nr:hypothetical protein ABI59_08665 [Acidobacteria bacterium Mor1]